MSTIPPAPSSSSTVHEGLPIPQRYWSISAILLGITLAVLDGSIANVSLPTIARELQTSPSSAVWVVNAYQLAVVVCLLPLAALGEIVGYRRIFVAGLSLFTLASLICALSPSLPVLIGGRALQGLGAAGMMSINAALVRFTYPSRMLGTAIGINAMTVAFASAAGPTVSSLILAVASWPWLFGINVPLGLLTLVLAWRHLPTPPLAKRSFDWISAVLSATAFGLLFLGVDHLMESPGLALLGLTVAVFAGVLLWRRSLSQKAPLLPLDLLRIPSCAFSVGASVCAFSAQMLGFVALPFHLQDLGRSQVETGFLMTPWPIAVAIAAPSSARLLARMSTSALCALGAGLMAAGLGFLALLPAGASTHAIVVGMFVAGAGFGLFQTPNNRAMLGAAPLTRSGAAGGMQSTARLFGQSLGAAIVALSFAAYASNGAQAALYVGVGAAVAAAMVSLSRRLGNA